MFTQKVHRGLRKLGGVSRSCPWLSLEHTKHHSTDLPSHGIRRQRLPPYPQIQIITQLDLQSFSLANFHTVRHGEHEFTACKDGFVHIYIQSYKQLKGLPSESPATFAVYYGPKHPLNTSGLVERAQDFPHASTYGFLQALRTIPDTAKLEKVCICVPNKHLLSLVDVELRECSDNSFRNVRNGRVIKDIVTCMEINQILRTRQNLLFRLKYVPNTLNVPAMYHCRKMAIAEAQKQTAPEVTLLE